jgi:hypothetical protein
MWWKLSALGLGTVGLIYLLFFMTVTTRAVGQFDFPEGSGTIVVHETLLPFRTGTSLIVLAVIIATSIWLAGRIVRRYRTTN